MYTAWPYKKTLLICVPSLPVCNPDGSHNYNASHVLISLDLQEPGCLMRVNCQLCVL